MYAANKHVHAVFLLNMSSLFARWVESSLRLVLPTWLCLEEWLCVGPYHNTMQQNLLKVPMLMPITIMKNTCTMHTKKYALNKLICIPLPTYRKSLHICVIKLVPLSFVHVGHYVSGLILSRQLKIEGFIVSRWLSQWPTTFKQLSQWIKEVLSFPKHVCIFAPLLFFLISSLLFSP